MSNSRINALRWLPLRSKELDVVVWKVGKVGRRHYDL